MSKASREREPVSPETLQFSIEADVAGLPAWTEIDEGRFMPRRVRGSCHGRVLG
jgi:hypothetical protein